MNLLKANNLCSACLYRGEVTIHPSSGVAATGKAGVAGLGPEAGSISSLRQVAFSAVVLSLCNGLPMEASLCPSYMVFCAPGQNFPFTQVQQEFWTT